MSKVTVVGAGAVGATCANVMACREVASEVVLIDIKEGLSEGKMLDMYQCSTLMDFDTKLVGVTNDYKQTANSDVVVITSGIPRKPGMTREELIGTNANIMKGVIENVVKYSPRAIIIVVANPMDTLTYLALKASGLPKNRIIGMGGALDSARFKCYLAKATGANINNVDGMAIGGRNIDEYDVAQLALCEIGNADKSLTALYAAPFVVIGILQICRYVHNFRYLNWLK